MNRQDSMSKLGTIRVERLMLSMSIPMILSMVLQAVYNIVDSAFVSNMKENGEAALNALTLAFPVQMLMVAIGIGTGVGTNALLAKSLGRGEREKVNYVAGNAVFLAVILCVAFSLFGFFGVRPYINTQTQNPLIAEMASDYLSICCVISIGIVFFSIFEKLLQATGRSHLSTIAQIAGAVTNVILDPILIYGWLGFSEYGVKGAAYATVIGQIVSMVIAWVFHLKNNNEITNKWKYLRPSGSVLGEIYAIGLPAIIAQALMSVMTYGLNIILGRVDEAAVTAYGLFYKIQQFVLFAAFGLRDAITPIVSFNHGMRSKSRVMEGIRCGMKNTLILMAAGFLLLEIFTRPLAALFGLSGDTQTLCISAMRIISVSFLFAGANIAFQGIFQALDSGKESLVLSVCRQILFVIPVAYGFSLLAGQSLDRVWLIWLTFPIAEGVTVLIAVFCMKKIRARKIEPMELQVL